jgi:hypothetical protein
LVFGSSAELPFQPSNLWRRAQRAWKRTGLQPIGLHEARHTFASILIAAGVNGGSRSSTLRGVDLFDFGSAPTGQLRGRLRCSQHNTIIVL